jgi:hypothetical protein
VGNLCSATLQNKDVLVIGLVILGFLLTVALICAIFIRTRRVPVTPTDAGELTDDIATKEREMKEDRKTDGQKVDS